MPRRGSSAANGAAYEGRQPVFTQPWPRSLKRILRLTAVRGLAMRCGQPVLHRLPRRLGDRAVLETSQLHQVPAAGLLLGNLRRGPLRC